MRKVKHRQTRIFRQFFRRYNVTARHNSIRHRPSTSAVTDTSICFLPILPNVPMRYEYIGEHHHTAALDIRRQIKFLRERQTLMNSNNRRVIINRKRGERLKEIIIIRKTLSQFVMENYRP